MTYVTLSLKILLLVGALIAPATAARTDALETDLVTKAIDMMAIASVYTSECHPPEDIKLAVQTTAVLYMQAAGVDGTEPRLRARFIILFSEYKKVAERTIGYCKAMTDAFIEGQEAK